MEALRLHDDRGSLPLALLAVVVIGSLAAVLTSTVVAGQRHTGFDQSYEQALPVAEVGLERVVALVENDQEEDSFSIPWTPVEGGEYRAEATLDEDGDWTLVAVGRTDRGQQRAVESRIAVQSLFDTAAFGKFTLDLNGNNTADSFRSGTFEDTGFVQDVTRSLVCRSGNTVTSLSTGGQDMRMCHQTGSGIVATNGKAFLRGQVYADVDAVQIHYARERIPDPLPEATGFCDGANTVCAQPYQSECQDPGPGVRKLQYCRDPIILPFDPVQPPWAPTAAFDGSGTLEPGVHVYTDVTLDSGTVIQGTPDEPTIIYLTGTLRIPNGQIVNMQQSGGAWLPRPSPGLLIFSAGTGPAIDFGNHVHVSAGIFAPNAAFSGGASGNVYGSLIAGSIANVGNWHFHYDEALGDVQLNFPRVAADWRETSVPDWAGE